MLIQQNCAFFHLLLRRILVGHTKGTILIGIENNGALLQLESMSYNWIRETSPLPAISSPSSIMHRLRLLISPWWLNTKSSSIALFAVWLKFSKNSLIFFSKLKLLLSIKYPTMLSLKLHLIYDLTTDEALVTRGKHLICSEFSHTIFRELLSWIDFFSFPLRVLHFLRRSVAWCTSDCHFTCDKLFLSRWKKDF